MKTWSGGDLSTTLKRQDLTNFNMPPPLIFKGAMAMLVPAFLN
jgi:hypothetical protein